MIKRIKIHQLLHAYSRGHQLIASSINVSHRDASLTTRLSDLSGNLTSDNDFHPYYTCYPLLDEKFYAIGKTWLDHNGTRAGCVITHTLLLDLADWSLLQTPREIDKYFLLPENMNNVDVFKSPIEIENTYPTNSSDLSINYDRDVCFNFVRKYFGNGIKPIIWFSDLNSDDYFWQIISFAWPNLRKNITCCTLCLQPRTYAEKAFDIMFTSSKNYSKFLSFPKESYLIRDQNIFINQNDSSIGKKYYDKIMLDVFAKKNSSHNHNLNFRGDLISALSEDPSEVKKIYFIEELADKIEQSPNSVISILDVIESIAPEGNKAVDTKKYYLNLALNNIYQSNDKDALKYYLLLSERMSQKAFSDIADPYKKTVSNKVESITLVNPALGLEVGAHLFSVNMNINIKMDPYTEGIIKGLAQLAIMDPNKLGILKSYPALAMTFVYSAPKIGAKLFYSQIDNIDGKLKSEFISWISNVSDSNKQIKIIQELIANIPIEEESYFIYALIKTIPKNNINELLDFLVTSNPISFTSIKSSFYQSLACNFPFEIQQWAVNKEKWSEDILYLLSATFPQNEVGFKGLIEFNVEDGTNKAIIILNYLKDVFNDQVPVWFIDFTRSFPSYLIQIFPHCSKLSDNQLSLINKILNNIWGINFSIYPELIEHPTIFSKYSFSKILVDQVMTSVLVKSISGELSWEELSNWQSQKWAINWFSEISKGDLEYTITKELYLDDKKRYYAWKWVLHSPTCIFTRSDSIIPDIVRKLAFIKEWDWNNSFTELWIDILIRAKNEVSQHDFLRLYTDALSFAFRHDHKSLSLIVVQTFSPVYYFLVNSSELTNELINVFEYVEWDKAKELRKRLVLSFLNSDWPPSDLAMAIEDDELFRKIFKRLWKKWGGPKYLEKMLIDLSNRNELEAKNRMRLLSTLLKNPDFYEPWI